MLTLAKELKLDGALLDKLAALDEGKIDANVEPMLAAAKRGDGITCLAVCLKYAKDVTAAEYEKRHIPRQIFLDTMQDIALWCDATGGKGLLNAPWLVNHLQCQLFRIGRLQYQFYRAENDELDYDCLPFQRGDNLLYVHIPAGEKLDYAACLHSLREAKLFMLSYFPAFSYDYFFCESWLLYRENQLFMAPDSNIMQFGLLFDIVYSVPDDRQAIERIFGKRHLFKALYPEHTALQRSAKEFMRRGGKLGMGIGVIHKNDIGV